MRQKPILLIDGDILIYRICCSKEKETFWPATEGYSSDVFTLHSDPNECMAAVVDTIEKLKEDFEAEKVLVMLSGDREKNFRKEILLSYKAQRKNMRLPLALGYVKEKIKEHYKVVQEERLEADDLLAIFATAPKDSLRIIISIDKDFETVPGANIHNTNKDAKGVYRTISPEVAEHNFLKQVLTGDRADNYLGLPNIGPVTADKILDAYDSKHKDKEGEPRSKLQRALDAYLKAGFGEEYFIQQARCAHLLRYNEYDFNTKTITPWALQTE